MPFVSVTRLRVRAIRFLPAFFGRTMRTRNQVAAAPGYIDGSLMPDRRWTFWTLTLWDNVESMRAYMTSGAHRAAMPKLMDWCDEASIVHWDQAEAVLPSWSTAEMRMRKDGRPSKVRHPSKDHLAMTFATPSGSTGTSIRPRTRA